MLTQVLHNSPKTCFEMQVIQSIRIPQNALEAFDWASLKLSSFISSLHDKYAGNVSVLQTQANHPLVAGGFAECRAALFVLPSFSGSYSHRASKEQKECSQNTKMWTSSEIPARPARRKRCQWFSCSSYQERWRGTIYQGLETQDKREQAQTERE